MGRPTWMVRGLAAALVAGACTPEERAPASRVEQVQEAAKKSKPPPAAERIQQPKPRRTHPDGAAELPLEFPTVPLDAAAGQRVLGPARRWLDNAIERGVEHQAFIFDPLSVAEPGTNASVVETRFGTRFTLPNALIVPIRAGQTAEPGDIVLTWWQSGSGLQRAIVVEGGAPESPIVRYLDIDLDIAAGWGKREEALPENGFHAIGAGEPGVTAACQDEGALTRWVLLRRAGDRLLLLGHAGRLAARSRQDCRLLPVRPKVETGDRVLVPRLGRFTEATVEEVDPRIGRVFVSVGGDRHGVGLPNVALAGAPPAARAALQPAALPAGAAETPAAGAAEVPVEPPPAE